MPLGSSLSPIWWACDMKRQFRKITHTLLFDVVDDSLRKGTFLHTLQERTIILLFY